MTLKSGYILAMRAPKKAVALDGLRIATSDFRLVDANGQSFGKYPTSSWQSRLDRRRPDWVLIPDLKATWDAMKKACPIQCRRQPDSAV
jgi:hypothetical protein